MKSALQGPIAAIFLIVSCHSFAADEKLAETHHTLAQKLALTPAQITKIEHIKTQTEKSLGGIDVSHVQDGAIVNAFKSGKWNESAVKQELEDVGKIQAQARYYLETA